MSESELLNQFQEDGHSLIKAGTHGGNRQKRLCDGEDCEFQIEQVKCEICFEIIGKCDMANFKTPMSGEIFISKDHKHGYPAPFYGHAHEWLELRCPICNNRPFLSKNFFHNEKDEKCGLTFECPTCGEGFKSSLALAGHKGAAHKEE
jgi:hypothetical protein